MMKITLIVFVIALSLELTSCKKNSGPIPSANSPINFRDVFEQFWNQMNTNYVYWDIDTTNWDNVYRKYSSIFGTLDLKNNNDIKKSIGYFRQITDGLIGSHYAINFIPTTIKDSFVFPAADRKIHMTNFHSPFLFSSIDSGYLDSGFCTGSYITISQQRIFAMSGTIQNKLLYFSCSQFALQEAYNAMGNNTLKKVIQYFFNQLQNAPANIKGIIIDVRNNSGGNIEDINFFLGQFIDRPLQFGYTRYKGGSGRLDYTPWITAKVLPQKMSKPLNLPIEVLADNYSISLAEAVTMVIRAMPRSIFIGEPTWGATGPITLNAVYNDGQFSVPNFLSVFTSSAEFKYIDGKIYEGTGFTPDISIPFNLAAAMSGKDQQLEAAVNLIR